MGKIVPAGIGYFEGAPLNLEGENALVSLLLDRLLATPPCTVLGCPAFKIKSLKSVRVETRL
jgi:hypothetical protein